MVPGAGVVAALPVPAGACVGVVPPLLAVLPAAIVATGLEELLPGPEDLLLLVMTYAPPAIAMMRITPARIIAGLSELFDGGVPTGAIE